jgi:hypothetical protein
VRNCKTCPGYSPVQETRVKPLRPCVLQRHVDLHLLHNRILRVTSSSDVLATDWLDCRLFSPMLCVWLSCLQSCLTGNRFRKINSFYLTPHSLFNQVQQHKPVFTYVPCSNTCYKEFSINLSACSLQVWGFSLNPPPGGGPHSVTWTARSIFLPSCPVPNFFLVSPLLYLSSPVIIWEFLLSTPPIPTRALSLRLHKACNYKQFALPWLLLISKIKRLARHAAHKSLNFWLETERGRDKFKSLVADPMMILKWIFKKRYDGGCVWLRQQPLHWSTCSLQ